jgi:predicted RNase H-like HicB family nuclease
VRQLIAEAIEFHLEGLRESGEAIPEPHSYVEYVTIASAA